MLCATNPTAELGMTELVAEPVCDDDLAQRAGSVARASSCVQQSTGYSPPAIARIALASSRQPSPTGWRRQPSPRAPPSRRHPARKIDHGVVRPTLGHVKAPLIVRTTEAYTRSLKASA